MLKKINVINQNFEIVQRFDVRRLLIISLCLNAILACIVFYNTTKVVYKSIIKHIVVEKEFEDVKLTDSGVTAALVKEGAVLAAMGCAQSKIESNHGKSNVGKEAKNLFGITYHKCPHVAGKHGVYAKYNTYQDCIKCYVTIQNKYLKNINGKYAEDPNYISTLKSVK
jgi:uncharacterized FlgJ-related protein